MPHPAIYFIEFWLTHPALLYGTSSLLGLYWAFSPSPLVLFPCLCLWTPCLILKWHSYPFNYKPFALSLLVTVMSAIYGMSAYPLPSLPAEGLKGKGYLEILSVSSQSTYFGRRWVYHCYLQDFFSHDSLPLYRIKCHLSFPHKNISRPPANCSYWIAGTLIQTSNGKYVLKVNKNELWHPIAGTWSIAEWRYQIKDKVKRWIQHQFWHKQAAIFLSGLVTGEFEDLNLRTQFSRFGLQHILAISGFHFAIIASLVNLLLRFLLSRKPATAMAIFLLTLYLLFLGGQPSVLRAWMMTSVGLIGIGIDKTPKGLNSLGVALLASLIWDPLQCREWSFQFSFLVTAGILCLYPSIDASLKWLLPTRPIHQLIEMPIWDQYGSCLLALFRQSTALTMSVTCIALPLALYHFHYFPIMSLLYNLFFPTLVSISLFLLLIGFILHLIPFIGTGIHSFNNIYTSWILALVYEMPDSIDHYYKVEEININYLIPYLSCVFMISIWLKSKKKEWPEWIFI